MRLQLRSSLVKPAKKVIGKQRLTVLVNVSFPAPNCKGKPSQASLFAWWVRIVGPHGDSHCHAHGHAAVSRPW